MAGWSPGVHLMAIIGVHEQVYLMCSGPDYGWVGGCSHYGYQTENKLRTHLSSAIGIAPSHSAWTTASSPCNDI